MAGGDLKQMATGLRLRWSPGHRSFSGRKRYHSLEKRAHVRAQSFRQLPRGWNESASDPPELGANALRNMFCASAPPSSHSGVAK